MWEVYVIGVVALIGLIVGIWSLVRTISLKKREILLEKHLNTIVPGFGGLGLGKIKDGTLDEVIEQLKPYIHKKIKEGTFVWPKPNVGVYSFE